MNKIIMTIFLLSTILISGCSSSLNTQQNQSIVLTKCPALRAYSPEKMQRAAASLKNIPDDSELIDILNDYGSLREACRLAERKLKSMK